MEESVWEPLIADEHRRKNPKQIVNRPGTKSTTARNALFFIVISGLSVSIAVPGLYLATVTAQCTTGLGLWLLVLSLINVLGTVLLTLQFSFQSVTSTQFCLCSLLPVPTGLVEAAWDLAGTALLHFRDSASEPLWGVCLALVLVSCTKLWVHCCYSSTLFASGCEMVGSAVWDRLWSGEDRHGKCCVCREAVTPGSEITPFHCEGNHLAHLACCPSSVAPCPVCRLEV